MDEQRMQVLQMISEGKITPEEGARLLDALGQDEKEPGEIRPRPARGKSGHMLRIRVIDEDGTKVNVNLPLGLVRSASRLATKVIPNEAREAMNRQGIDLSEIDIEELVNELENGTGDGRLVDIQDEDGTKVEIYVD